MTREDRICASVLLLVALVVATTAAVAQPAKPVRISTVAISMNSIAGAGMVEFVIERWSTDAERTAFIAAFKKKGNDGLLDLMQHQKTRVGYVHGAQFRGYDLRFARQMALGDGGTRIILAADRYIPFIEARNNPRVSDYPFTLVEIHLDKNGKGDGRMLVATRLNVNEEKVVEVENYGQQPIRLNDVKLEK
jgi:hypothetical protein